ncbi:hypothetical protein BJX63DRAFT_67651 [Aspergillus granulosus]|uniref:Uncharacterized protein n=1 Tax=Aspergillus granulosus TaxID=176169 RepID=A0ABR4GWE3_9EURO
MLRLQRKIEPNPKRQSFNRSAVSVSLRGISAMLKLFEFAAALAPCGKFFTPACELVAAVFVQHLQNRCPNLENPGKCNTSTASGCTEQWELGGEYDFPAPGCNSHMTAPSSWRYALTSDHPVEDSPRPWDETGLFSQSGASLSKAQSSSGMYSVHNPPPGTIGSAIT